jgi:hypothetical protein
VEEEERWRELVENKSRSVWEEESWRELDEDK